MNCQRNVNYTPPTQLPHKFSYIVARLLHNHFESPNIPGDQEGLFKLAIQLRKLFNWVIYNTATGYVLLVYLTNI
jgi:hypothetical protein